MDQHSLAPAPAPKRVTPRRQSFKLPLGQQGASAAPEAPFWLTLALASLLFALLHTLGSTTDAWRDDEALTYYTSGLPWGLLFERGTSTIHPPLFYATMKLWRTLWPAAEAMKLLTGLHGLAALWLAALAARRIGGARLGATLALLWATFPMLIHYSQDARMYPMLLMLECLALYGWTLAASRPRTGWVVFVGACTLGLYTQNLFLIFAAALVGGETLRQLWRLGRGRGSVAELRWILSAAFALALAYAPWLPFLLRQSQHPNLVQHFQVPTLSVALNKFFFYPYSLGQFVPLQVWAWVPGVVLLGLLPLAYGLGGLRQSLRRPAHGAVERPLGLVLWSALAPLGFLLAYSRLGKPVFELTRHGLMFLPLVLFATAAWFAARPARRWRRLLLASIAASGLLAVLALGQTRDYDLRPQRDDVLQHAPLKTPIFVYPCVPSFVSLLYAPVPLYDYYQGVELPEQFPDVTLVIDAGLGPNREEIKRQAKITVGQAREVKHLFSSYKMSIYQLKGLPPGALRSLAYRMPGLGLEKVAEQTGRWTPAHVWPAAQLKTMLKPAGQLIPFSPVNPNWQGVRLDAPQTTLTLPLAGLHQGGVGALLLGGEFILGQGRPAELEARLVPGRAGAPGDRQTLSRAEFSVFRLLSGPAESAQFALATPKEFTRLTPAAPGKAPAGLYLTWAGYLPLRPEHFAKAGYTSYLDVGAMGDELFVREGFHEAEGMPPHETRWTSGTFTLQVPVFAEHPVREVCLVGFLAKDITHRAIELSINGGELKTSATFPGAEWGEYRLPLPRPLAAGVHELTFTLAETWQPSKSGGTDPRALGFYLDGVGLRE